MNLQNNTNSEMLPLDSSSAENNNESKDESRSPATKVDQEQILNWKAGLIVAFFALLLGLLTQPLVKPASKMAELEGRRTTDTPMKEKLYKSCSKSRLGEFLLDEPVAGYHVVCFEKNASGVIDTVHFFKNGRQEGTEIRTTDVLDWRKIRELLETKFSLLDPDNAPQPWALYSTKGERLLSGDHTEFREADVVGMMTTEEIILVYSGGQFLWPGVRLGFRRQVELYSIMPPGDPQMPQKNRTVTLETISLTPLVFSVEGFMSDEDADHIQQIADPTLQYSQVVLMDKDAGRPASDFRTSQTTFLSASEDDILLDIEFRTSSLTRIPRSHQEDVQVLRYGTNEKYDSHHDYFDPSYYQNDPNTLNLIKDGVRNRLATVFWYLSDVEEGGETIFPRFQRGRETSMQDCETGLKVKPRKGRALIFYSMTADGKIDRYSLHGACPVKAGVKYAANKWLWNEPMWFTS